MPKIFFLRAHLDQDSMQGSTESLSEGESKHAQESTCCVTNQA